MDWFRRNWPDLVIGVALVAVVALIVVTLLSGGSLAALVRRDTPANLITDTTGPDAAETASPGANPDATAQAAAPDGVADGIDVFVPGVPNEAAGAEAGTQAGSAEQADSSTQPDVTNAPATPAGGEALPQAAAAGGFRVAAGAVDSRPAAVSLAETYRENSLPVTVEQQDDLYLLWVGPYATRPQADRVAASIVEGGGDALVYTYDGGDATTAETAEPVTAPEVVANTSQTDVVTETASATAQADIAVASAPSTNTPAGVATNAAATDTAIDTATVTDAATTATAANTADDATAVGQRYLQVGAFVSDESAAPLRSQLETLGLNVSRTEDETGLVRLFVGPFEDARLAQTQSRLSAEGIVGSFPVTR